MTREKPMHVPYRLVALGLVTAATSLLVLARAQAGGSHYFPPVADPVVREECGSCHITFAPSMLPASSWKRMTGDLKNHFGDDASLEAGAAAHISGYLTANAGDSGGQRYGEKLLRGASMSNPPLRITELPRWIREHRKVPEREWQTARTKANCRACHADAERGVYDD